MSRKRRNHCRHQELTTTRHSNNMLFSVVFFTMINPERNWRAMLTEQLSDVVSSGLSSEARSFDIVLSGSSNSTFDDETEKSLDTAGDHVKALVPEADVWKFANNRFEYPGIRRVWDVARHISGEEASRHLILYFHGKGMVNGAKEEPNKTRTSWNKELTDNVVVKWRDIAHAFFKGPSIEKAGYTVSDGGFPWFNFW